MPAKITLAGENTYQIYISERLKSYPSPHVKTYQTNTTEYGGRKRVEDVHSWAQPLCQSLIATQFVEFSNLILKDSKDGGSRVT